MSTNHLLLLSAIEARQRALEEEEMTHYTQEELDDWEFKFIRSATASFRKPEVLEALLEEEAKYGWVLLEKFDDGRIRLKRRKSARARDHRYISQGEDPYRTHYGISPQQATVRGLLFGLGFTALIVAIVFIIFWLTGTFDYY